VDTERFRTILIGERERVRATIDHLHEANSEHVLGSIDEALRRIETGTYGTCVRCGKPISEERLEAIPYATRCIDCQRFAERG
jgi:RNA polymerase-binding transcription factor DksA